jgi:hypothetical protein
MNYRTDFTLPVFGLTHFPGFRTDAPFSLTPSSGHPDVVRFGIRGEAIIAALCRLSHSLVNHLLIQTMTH